MRLRPVGYNHQLELGPWDMGTHHCPQPGLEASSIWMLLDPSPQSPKFPSPQHRCCSPPRCITPGANHRGVPEPRPPSQEPTARLPNEEQMGRHRGEAAPGLLMLPWKTPLVSWMSSLSRGVPVRVCGWHWRADGFGKADVSDGVVTAMPTHPLPPLGYF